MGVSIPLSFTNTLFYMWIMKSLGDTKERLKERNQIIKYNMMQKFTYSLAFVYIAGASTVFGEIYLKFYSSRKEWWRHQWAVEASWEMIFTLFVLSVMIIMRPSPSSKLLAYIEELGDETATHGSSPPNQSDKQEDIEMVEMPSKNNYKYQEKLRLDENKVKSDDQFVEVELPQHHFNEGGLEKDDQEDEETKE
jgi:hypothetical protein